MARFRTRIEERAREEDATRERRTVGDHVDVYRWFSGRDPEADRADALLGLIGARGRWFRVAPATR